MNPERGVLVRGRGGRKDARGGRRAAEWLLKCGTLTEPLSPSPGLLLVRVVVVAVRGRGGEEPRRRFFEAGAEVVVS